MKKIFCAAALALSLAIPLAACRGAASSAASPAASSGVTEAAQSAGGFTFTDSLGRTVTLAAPPQRVAAMLGSYADIWLLAGGELAAATQDAWDEGIVTGEETVNVGSHQQPNAESLLAAAPDFVLLTPDIDTQLALRDTLEAAGVPCAYLHVDSLEEYLAALKLCTDLTGRADLYEENGEAVRGRVEETIASVQGKEAPDVLLLRAFSSGVKAKGADNFVGAMLADLGAVNIADRDASLLEDLQMEAIVAADPDVILVTTMGDEEKAVANFEDTLQADPAWRSLRAVQDGRVYMLDKALFHYKPNERWAESYETLADILYTE